MILSIFRSTLLLITKEIRANEISKCIIAFEIIYCIIMCYTKMLLYKLL
jgi:hypothetical protein